MKKKETPLAPGHHLPLQESGTPYRENPLFRKLFWIAAGILLPVMLFLSFNYSITGDERFYKPYGESALNYYLTWGKDTSALFVNTGDGGKLHCYGPSIDLFTAALNKYINWFGEFEMRHLVNAMIGFLLILYCGLTASSLAGWRAGLIALLFMALSPRIFGDGMNNPRDPAFAAFYIFTVYYLIQFLKQLPAPPWKTVFLLATGIGLAIGARIGALLLVAYAGLFTLIELWSRKELKEKWIQKNYAPIIKIFSRLGIAIIGGYCLGILFWPFGLVSPIEHPLEALDFFTNNPYRIKTLFEGRQIWSDEVPWYYIPKWVGISSPLIVLFGLALFFLLILKIKTLFNIRFVSVLLFVGLFPVFYIIYKHSSLYNGWRHSTFIYAPLVILSALPFEILFRIFKQKAAHIIIGGMIAIGLLPPLSWMIKNHPLQSVYFNELTGGVDGAYGKYETDYFGVSLKKAAEWLSKHEDLSKPGTVVACNFPPLIPEYYLKKNYPGMQVNYVRYRERVQQDWDYFLVTTQLINKSVFTNKKSFPPKGTIYTVKIGNTPICAVVKRNDKSDYYGHQAMNKKDFQGAVSFFKQALQYDDMNESALTGLAEAYLNLGNMELAADALQKSLLIYPDNEAALNMMGVIYLRRQEFDRAILTFDRLIKLSPGYDYAYMNTGIAYAQKGDLNNAIRYLQFALSINPNLREAYQYLGIIYQQKGDTRTAQEYLNRAKGAAK